MNVKNEKILTVGVIILMLCLVHRVVAEDVSFPPPSEWDVWRYLGDVTPSEEEDLWPGNYTFFPGLECERDTKDNLVWFFLGHLKATGDYVITFIFDYFNPHDKWNSITGDLHHALTDPGDLIGNGPFLFPIEVKPSKAFVPRNTAVLSAQTVTYRFTAVTTGDIYCFFWEHSCITDFNGDGKVDWKDLLLLARNYGKYLYDTGRSDPAYLYDISCDFIIGMVDMFLFKLDYGKTIPPYL